MKNTLGTLLATRQCRGLQWRKPTRARLKSSQDERTRVTRALFCNPKEETWYLAEKDALTRLYARLPPVSRRRRRHADETTHSLRRGKGHKPGRLDALLERRGSRRSRTVAVGTVYAQLLHRRGGGQCSRWPVRSASSASLRVLRPFVPWGRKEGGGADRRTRHVTTAAEEGE